MDYSTILNELDKVELKDKFISEYETFVSESFLEKVKKSKTIHGPGNLIRHLMEKYEDYSDKWEYWRKVLIYFLTPEFSRIKNF